MRWLVQVQSEQEANRRKVPKLSDLLTDKGRDKMEAARDWTATQTTKRKRKRNKR